MIDALDQFRALTRSFFARFFESEITAGADDMKQSFFWLLAALAMPGIFIPTLMSFEWGLVGRFKGYDVLRTMALGEKAFYLGASMISAGALTAIAWTSLLPDKRDTLILGAMPVRPSMVVTAKLAALAGFVGLIAVGTHLAGTLAWGSILGNDAPRLGLMLRGFLAHFVAASAITATTALTIAAAQGLALALLGPRLFRPASTLLQIVTVGVLALFFALLPAINVSAVHTVTGGPRAQPWLLALPPMWFLGLYEWMLGTTNPAIVELARRAALSFGIAAAGVILSYPLAYRRLMVSVVESGRYQRSAITGAFHAALVGISGRHAAARAAADFFSTTIGRVERHRFVLAITLGLALAWSLPGLRAYEPSVRPQASVLALPIAVMMFLLAGVRVASALPGDVRAAWLFEVHDLSRQHARQALERVLFALCVLPPILVSSPIFWILWGANVALTHAVVMAALGVATLQFLIWHCNGMPCGQPWTPARMGFGRRWPLHFAFFLIVVVAVPRLEVVLFERLYLTTFFVSCLVVLAVATRIASARHQIVPIYEDVDPVAGVLRIN